MVQITIELTGEGIDCQIYGEDITDKGYLIEWKKGYDRQMLCLKCYKTIIENGHGTEFRLLGTWGQ